MNLLQTLAGWNPRDPVTFMLILSRVSGMVVSMPILSSRAIPVKIKALVSMALAFLMFPLVRRDMTPYQGAFSSWLIGLFSEFATGIAIGFSAYLIFSAVALAGEMAGVQVGFGIVDVINPLGLAEVPLLGTFQNSVAFLVFLATNAQYAMIWGLAESFRWVPLGGGNFGPFFFEGYLSLFGRFVELGFVLASPFLVGGIVLNLVMGFLSKMMPQLNLLTLGFPLLLLGGLVLFMASLPFFGSVVEHSFSRMESNLPDLLKLLGSHG